jgi:hypothetical protein
MSDAAPISDDPLHEYLARVALHEASHGVVRFALRLPLAHVSMAYAVARIGAAVVVPVADAGGDPPPPRAESPRTVRRTVRARAALEFVAHLAGASAERQAFPSTSRLDARFLADYTRARTLLPTLLPTPRDAEALLPPAFAAGMAHADLLVRALWPAVNAVAEALLAPRGPLSFTVGRSEVRDLVRGAGVHVRRRLGRQVGASVLRAVPEFALEVAIRDAFGERAA